MQHIFPHFVACWLADYQIDYHQSLLYLMSIGRLTQAEILSISRPRKKNISSYYCHKSLLYCACTIENKTAWWTPRASSKIPTVNMCVYVAFLKSPSAPKLLSIMCVIIAVQFESNKLFQQQDFQILPTILFISSYHQIVLQSYTMSANHLQQF